MTEEEIKQARAMIEAATVAFEVTNIDGVNDFAEDALAGWPAALEEVERMRNGPLMTEYRQLKAEVEQLRVLVDWANENNSPCRCTLQSGECGWCELGGDEV